MKKLYSILTLILISISIFAKSTDTYSDKILSFGKGNRETRERADSIMHLVIEKATQYQNTVSKYEAEIYIKGRTEILKQNMLIRLAHHIFPIDRKNKDMLFEMVSQSKFNAPQNYLHDLKAVNGNSITQREKAAGGLGLLEFERILPYRLR